MNPSTYTQIEQFQISDGELPSFSKINSNDEIIMMNNNMSNINDNYNNNNNRMISISTSGYTKINKKQQQLDIDGILNQYKNNNNRQTPQHKPITPPFMTKKSSSSYQNKKVSKISSGQSCGFNNIRKKYQGQIDFTVSRIKLYIADTKYNFDLKHKQALLQLSRYLIMGVYELKQYKQSYGNDITKNQLKIISEDTDLYEWIRILIENFDTEFKEYQNKNQLKNQIKIKNNLNSLIITNINGTFIKSKWQILVKNCKDQTNFQLRRKILRKKVLPIHVLQNNQQFLLSEQAKQQKKRQLRLILADAQHDLTNNNNDQNQQEKINTNKQSQQSHQQIQIPCINNKRSSNNLIELEKIKQEENKLQEYLLAIGDAPIQRMRNRIEEDLKGFCSYERVISHFNLLYGQQ